MLTISLNKISASSGVSSFFATASSERDESKLSMSYTWPCSTCSLGPALLHHHHHRYLSSQSHNPIAFLYRSKCMSYMKNYLVASLHIISIVFIHFVSRSSDKEGWLPSEELVYYTDVIIGRSPRHLRCHMRCASVQTDSLAAEPSI